MADKWYAISDLPSFGGQLRLAIQRTGNLFPSIEPSAPIRSLLKASQSPAGYQAGWLASGYQVCWHSRDRAGELISCFVNKHFAILENKAVRAIRLGPDTIWRTNLESLVSSSVSVLPPLPCGTTLDLIQPLL